MVQGGRRVRDWDQGLQSVEVKVVSRVKTNISPVISRGTSVPWVIMAALH